MIINKLSAQLQLALNFENLFPTDIRGLFIFSENQGLWKIIMQYNNRYEEIASTMNLTIFPLGGGFAEVIIEKNSIGQLSNYPNVVYLSIPVPLDYIQADLSSVCGSSIGTEGNFIVSGENVLLAVIDSGIRYNHPSFIDNAGNTRILYLWDQGIEGTPPTGFSVGTEYSSEEINRALRTATEAEQLEIVPSVDTIGHGTAMAGIAAGGVVGGILNRGVAPSCQLIIVKVGGRGGRNRPTDLEIMQGISYSLNKARELEIPIVILLGSGNNLTAHNGSTPLELFIDAISNTWACNVVIGTGNEGNRSSHASGQVLQGQTQSFQLLIEGEKESYGCAIWRSFSDEFELVLTAPTGERTDVLSLLTPNQAYLFDRTAVLVNFTEPTTELTQQQILILFFAQDNININSGLWTFALRGQRIVEGQYDVWGSIVTNSDDRTRFLSADTETTLVSPSTSRKITSVASFNGPTNQFAPFSGRGYTADRRIKPDLAAPGVNVRAPSISTSELYTTFTGSCAAAAYVAGSYALMMSYGIYQLNNVNFYGDFLKIYLLRNTKKLTSYIPYPNPSWGYGVLCIEAALNNMREVTNQG